jgi:hypothetical protein
MKWLLFLFVLLISSCGQNLGTDEGEEFKVVDLNPAFITFADINELILGPKCLNCHSWVSNEAEFDKRIIEGDPEKSPLYQQIESGRMPLGGPELTQSEKQLVYNFIANKVKKPEETLPDEQDENEEDIIIEVDLFERVKSEILIPRCLSCHAWANDDDSIKSLYVAGEPNTSKLFQVVESDTMPLFGPPLSDEEKGLIWEMISDQ